MPVATEPAQSHQHFVLHGVSYQLYKAMLKELGEQRIYLTYANGELELMSPLPKHERLKKYLGRLVEALAEEMNMPICSLGSTTYRRDDLEKGLEPDECYYIQHESQMRAREEIDLSLDPPPDLVIEVDVTHRAIDREAIYAAMGVPEIWRYDLRRLEFLRLERSAYRQTGESRAFPKLKPADLEQFLAQRTSTDETTMIRRLREWVNQEFKSR